MDPTLRSNLRIIWAIAVKDIVDAVKNTTSLSIVLGVGLMMVVGMALPLLLGLRGTPTVVVYDPNRSTLIRGLTARSEFRVRLVDSQEEMESVVSGSVEQVLGIVIPEGFRQAEGSGSSVEMNGYFAHWAKPASVNELVTLFEEELSKASWQTVHINVAGHQVYPSTGADGQPFMAAMNLTILTLIIGITLVPYLLIEEKEARTFDALLVSPARLSHVVIGKALAGAFYCLCAAVVVLLFNTRWIVHWELAVLAVFLGAALAVAVGLLMGATCDTYTTVGLWAGLLMMLLVVPMLLARLVSAKLPAIVQAALPWMPSVALSKLVGLSMVGAVPVASIGSNAGILVAEVLVIYAVVIWYVRRSSR